MTISARQMYRNFWDPTSSFKWICTHGQIYIYIYIYIYMYVCICMDIYTYILTYIYSLYCTHIHMYTQWLTWNLSCESILTHYMYLHTHMCVCVYSSSLESLFVGVFPFLVDNSESKILVRRPSNEANNAGVWVLVALEAECWCFGLVDEIWVEDVELVSLQLCMYVHMYGWMYAIQNWCG